MSEQASQNPIRVCLGFPPFHAQAYLARLEAIEGVEATILPIDPGVDWASQTAEQPYAEPPPWGASVAAEILQLLTGLVAHQILYRVKDRCGMWLDRDPVRGPQV